MPRVTRDSYTHESYVEDYKSPYVGINEPRRFYKKNTPEGAEYRADLTPDNRWLVTRAGTAASWLPAFKSEATAREVLDWLVLNDASVDVAIHWFNRGDLQPMFKLYDRIADIIRRT